MAGDHKCPVCSSTFTRPQHVSRHMRSHTGDRPYKCTHCGDQFARSDLLSRHVNKSHAAVAAQPARRKTNPQPPAPGPVPQLLPPPASRTISDPCTHAATLPCAKCLQRPYVAPNDPPRLSSAARHQHDLFDPSSHPATSAAPDPVFPPRPTFNFTVPLYPQTLAPPHLDTPESSSTTVYDTTSLRPHQEFDNSTLPLPPHMPAPYPDPKKQHDPFLPQPYSDASLPPFLFADPTSHSYTQTYGFDPADFYFDPSTHDQPPLGSDAFALPHHPQQPFHDRPPLDAAPHHDVPHGAGLQPLNGPPGPGEFSSAFGLMSLEDPAVAAEMNKGASFFAPGAMHTPAKSAKAMPSARDPVPAIPTPNAMNTSVPAREIAELRDFWKTFMRDHSPGEKPANGPSMFTAGPGPGEKAPAHPSMFTAAPGAAARPALRRSLSKVASLPDIKTPLAGTGPQHGAAHLPPRAEDLRSYEQAVLARPAPSLTLPPPRPAFKRLASQTLGPFESKSAKVEHRDGGAGAAYDAGVGRHPHPRPHARSPSGEFPPAVQRDRRLSAPSTSATRPAFAPE